MDINHPTDAAALPENQASHILVTCTNFGAHDMCNECGARTPHLNTFCEPCPVDKVDHCKAAIAENVPGEAIQKEGWANDSTDQPVVKNAFYHVFPAAGEGENVLVFRSALEVPEGEMIRLEKPPIPTGKARNAPCACGSGKKFKNCCGRSNNLRVVKD